MNHLTREQSSVVALLMAVATLPPKAAMVLPDNSGKLQRMRCSSAYMYLSLRAAVLFAEVEA